MQFPGNYLSSYLTDCQFKFFKSKEFIERTEVFLLSLISTYVQKAADSIMKLNKGILFVRKSTIFSINFGQMRLAKLEEPLVKLFIRLLEPAIKNEHNPITNLDLYTNTLNNSMYVRGILDGCLLMASRKAMLSNNTLSPVIIERNVELNEIGQPIYYELDQTAPAKDSPSSAVYIGTP